MTIRGKIVNGEIELEGPVDVPDGTLVEIRLLSESARTSRAQGNYPDISNFTFDDFVGIAEGVDASDEAIARYILEKHS